MSQVVESPVSWHCSLQIPLLQFPVAQLLRFMQPPATLPHIVLGGGWGVSLAKSPSGSKKMPWGFCSFAVVQLQGKRLHPVHPAGLEVCQSQSWVLA